MDFSILWYIPVFLVSLTFVAVVIPAIVRTASRINLYDSQDERKVHQGDIPRLGGISFLPAIGVPGYLQTYNRTYDVCSRMCAAVSDRHYG